MVKEEFTGLNYLAESEDNTEPSWDSTSNENSPASRFVKMVLYQAVTDKATDIYFETYEHEFKIRYRVLGDLYEMVPPPRRLAGPVSEEIKGLFGLVQKGFKQQTKWEKLRHKNPEIEIVPLRHYGSGDIASRRMKIGGKEIDFNLSMLPTNIFENYHIEIFNQDIMNMKLNDEIQGILTSVRNGLIILSSPFDNGKTTTAYQMLQFLNRPYRAVVAVERKPSYSISGISKVLVDTHAKEPERTLDAIRTYSPDIVFFDDLSDVSTAREALSYANNGKLAIVALTSRSIRNSLEVLANLSGGMEKVVPNLRAAVTQRLVKQSHNECRGLGCPKCGDRGYEDRIAVYGIIDPDKLRECEKDIGTGYLKRVEQEGSIDPSLDRLVEDKTISKDEANFQKNI